MINNRYMKPGSWSQKLVDDTPRSVMNKINIKDAGVGFSQYFCIPVWIDPDDVSWSDMQGLIRWSGIYVNQDGPDGLEIGGPGAICYLGDEQGIGPLYTEADVAISAKTCRTWIMSYVLQAGSQGITEGSIPSGGATREGNIIAGDSRRDVLDSTATKFKKAWRLNGDLTLDVDTNVNLFVEHPTVILWPDAKGRDTYYYGMRGQVANKAVTLEEWTSKTIVTPNGDLWVDEQTVTIASNPYYNPAGGSLSRERWLAAHRSPDAASCLDIAEHAQGKFDQPLTTLTFEADEFDPGRYFQPGDYVYVYDPESRIVNLTKEIEYMGQEIHPMKLRVQSIEYDQPDGWGHYLRVYDEDAAGFKIIDITDYVEPAEEAKATVELGWKYRLLPIGPQISYASMVTRADLGKY